MPNPNRNRISELVTLNEEHAASLLIDRGTPKRTDIYWLGKLSAPRLDFDPVLIEDAIEEIIGLAARLMEKRYPETARPGSANAKLAEMIRALLDSKLDGWLSALIRLNAGGSRFAVLSSLTTADAYNLLAGGNRRSEEPVIYDLGEGRVFYLTARTIERAISRIIKLADPELLEAGLVAAYDQLEHRGSAPLAQDIAELLYDKSEEWVAELIRLRSPSDC